MRHGEAIRLYGFFFKPFFFTQTRQVSASSRRLFARNDRLATDSGVTKSRDVFMHAHKYVGARKCEAIKVSLASRDEKKVSISFLRAVDEIRVFFFSSFLCFARVVQFLAWNQYRLKTLWMASYRDAERKRRIASVID